MNADGSKFLLAALLGAAAWTCACVLQPVRAQAAEPADTEISGQQMRQLARAQLRIAAIQERYRDQLQASADDARKAQRLQERGHREIVQAVQSVRLDVETFKLMMWRIPRDPELKQRFFAVLEAQRESDGETP